MAPSRPQLLQRHSQPTQPTPWPSRRSGEGNPHSRFVEGSMNDRVSAAPPPNFLGPGEAAAYERQFYTGAGLDTITASPSGGGPYPPRSNNRYYPPSAQRQRPMSSSGPSPSQPVSQHQQQQQQQPQQLQPRKSKFFAPLWDGVREKFYLTRSRSVSSMGRALGKEDRGSAATVAAMPVVARGSTDERQTAAVDTTAYPTREEVMESYKSLVASGFFDAHAIKGTRHPLQQPGAAPSGDVPPPVPRHTHPPVAMKSFAQHQAAAAAASNSQKYPKPPGAQAFPSAPYGGATKQQPTAAANLPVGAPPAPQTRPPPPPVSMRPPPPPQPEGMDSPSRGTKRGMPTDNESETASSTGGTGGGGTGGTGGARKLVKKLRRSASRISMDLSLGNTSIAMAKPRPSTSSAAPPSVFGKDTPRPSVSSIRNVPPPPPEPMASFESSPAPLANNPFYISADDYPPAVNAAIRTPPSKKTKNKLTKISSATKDMSAGRRLIGTLGLGGVGLRRVPPTTNLQQQNPEPQHQRQQESKPQPHQQTRPPIVPPAATAASQLLPPPTIGRERSRSPRKSFGDIGSDDDTYYDSDAMVIDSPPPMVHQAVVAKAMVAPAPSAFHYPQRQRTLAVLRRSCLPATTSETTANNGGGNGLLLAEPLQVVPDFGNRVSPQKQQHGVGFDHYCRYQSNNTYPYGDNGSGVIPRKKLFTSSSVLPTASGESNDNKISAVAAANYRDSGLGHAVSSSSGGEDSDMENYPPPNVPTGPSGGYVW
ncbi:hypothetical protein B0H66DRAFT_340408 [Apodospora peruviana]|uniref:Uncharacterized protein n=1 Tax=Apodospora peruviana TaxID=516989 RepID=A0AAE0HYI0_9PEZI|nr:hypothetical protein B0H66DRAFT_340408 [Apodospora peruviana]